MGQQFLDRVQLAAEAFLVGNEIVDRRVAVAADGDRLAHLLAREPFLKPLVLVAGARNQVMRGAARLGRSAA